MAVQTQFWPPSCPSPPFSLPTLTRLRSAPSWRSCSSLTGGLGSPTDRYSRLPTAARHCAQPAGLCRPGLAPSLRQVDRKALARGYQRRRLEQGPRGRGDRRAPVGSGIRWAAEEPEKREQGPHTPPSHERRRTQPWRAGGGAVQPYAAQPRAQRTVPAAPARGAGLRGPGQDVRAGAWPASESGVARPAGLFAGAPKGAHTCPVRPSTFSNVSNFYVHSASTALTAAADGSPQPRRPKAAPPCAAPCPAIRRGKGTARSSPGPGAREDEAGARPRPGRGPGASGRARGQP